MAHITIDIPITKEIEWYIQSRLPDIVNEFLFKNPQELDNIIKKCVAGQFRAVTNEVLQSKELKAMIYDKVLNQIKGDLT